MYTPEDAATPDAHADADEDTITLDQTAHPRKISAKTNETTSLIMDTRQRLIRCEHHGRSWLST